MRMTLNKLFVKLRLLAVCERGQDLVEYGLLTAVIALACISSMQGVANSVDQVFGQVSSAFSPQSPSSSGSGGGGDDGWR